MEYRVTDWELLFVNFSDAGFALAMGGDCGAGGYYPSGGIMSAIEAYIVCTDSRPLVFPRRLFRQCDSVVNVLFVPCVTG